MGFRIREVGLILLLIAVITSIQIAKEGVETKKSDIIEKDSKHIHEPAPNLSRMEVEPMPEDIKVQDVMNPESPLYLYNPKSPYYQKGIPPLNGSIYIPKENRVVKIHQIQK